MTGYRFDTVPEVREGLKRVSYLADDGIAGVVYLADRLQKPVLVEGPAGTGKTQLAKSTAEMSGARLIRLQCYEGLDESKALYEWNYKKQLLRIQADRQSEGWSDIHDDIFSEEFLLTRPLLTAIRRTDHASMHRDPIRRGPVVCAGAVGAGALVVLAGGATDKAVLKTLAPDPVCVRVTAFTQTFTQEQFGLPLGHHIPDHETKRGQAPTPVPRRDTGLALGSAQRLARHQ